MKERRLKIKKKKDIQKEAETKMYSGSLSRSK